MSHDLDIDDDDPPGSELCGDPNCTVCGGVEAAPSALLRAEPPVRVTHQKTWRAWPWDTVQLRPEPKCWRFRDPAQATGAERGDLESYTAGWHEEPTCPECLKRYRAELCIGVDTLTGQLIPGYLNYPVLLFALEAMLKAPAPEMRLGEIPTWVVARQIAQAAVDAARGRR